MLTYSTLPYWWQDPRFQADGLAETPDQLPAEVDVAIIGGGYTGLSAALTLARAGQSVAVLDTELPGWGCSGRNGGLIGPSFHKLGISGLTRLYGRDKMMEILQESLNGLQFLVDFIGAENIDCDLNICGRFRGACQPKHYDSLARQSDELAKVLNFPATMVPQHQQHNEIGSERYFGGVIYHLDGNLQPALLAQGIARKAIDAGARIFSNSYVAAIKQQRGNFDLKLTTGKLRAGDVIIATNGYTDRSFKAFKRRLLPIRSAMIATEELNHATMRSLSPNMRSHGGTERLVQYYRPSPDGKRMLFGGRSIAQSDQPQEYVPFLRRCMLEIYPQLNDVQISNAWSGVVAYTFDHVPHIGKLNGIHYAMGYCGSGVARATFFGRKIALKLLQDDEGQTAFDDLPFNGKPFYSGKPWFLPLVLRWYDLLDRNDW